VSLNLLLVDDHSIVTDGIKALLQHEADITIKGEAPNGKIALDMLRVLKIDLVLMDIDMPELNGVDTLKVIKKEFAHIKVVMLTMHDEKAMISKLIDLGADGYLLKNSSKAELLTCLRGVANNEKYISSEATSILLQVEEHKIANSALAQLTERELEIIRLIAEGLSNKEIGEKLFISHRTVDTHRTNLMSKIEVHNVAGIVKFAITNGLLD
jgi:two-component system, NarL family, nitrate/nitrite response regulator NarL